MTAEDLFKMLDIKAKPSRAKVDPLEVDTVQHTENPTPDAFSDTVLAVDSWDRAQGESLKERVTDPILSTEAASDFFAAYFHQSPEVNPVCIDGRRQRFIETLLESSDYQLLHQSTMADPMAAEMAAIELSRQWCVACQSDKKEELANLAAIGKAVSTAQEQIDEMQEAMSALGMDKSAGGNGKTDSKKIAATFNRIRNSHRLRRICELAGRYRRAAQAKQRMKVSHGYDEMIGVEMDGDVSRLLPVELAKLADEDLELDAMRRLVERQSMCRQYRGVDKQAKGPIVVCVDESGSMDGDPICNAKAFALAMAWIARHQGRWCALVSFSDATSGRFLALPPGRWDEVALLDWLGAMFNGGTDCYVPLVQLPNEYWQQMGAPKGKTDIIIVTDGQVDVPHRYRESFRAWKAQEQVKLRSIVMAEAPGELASVSDECHLIRSISLDEQAIDKCLGV